MNTKHGAAPAFPQSFTVITVNEKGQKIAQDYADCPGMSLRAWLAGQALASMLAIPATHSGLHEGKLTKSGLAFVACQLADALIAELNREEGK